MPKGSIVFFGTPDFAVPSLEILVKNFNVLYCVTKPASLQGRGLKKQETAVQKIARKLKISMFQPATLSLNKEEGKKFYEFFKNKKPDLAVVVAYGKIIPDSLLKVPKYGFINLHPSLLPRWRGADPLRAVILAGDAKTGVTIIKLNKDLDAGDIIVQHELTLTGKETFGELHDKLKIFGAESLNKILPAYLSKKIKLSPQDHRLATYCYPWKSQDCLINWCKKNHEIYSQIRAFSPRPCAYTYCLGKRVKIIAAEMVHNQFLLIKKVQKEGKKSMAYTDFLNGYPQCDFVKLRKAS